MRPNEVVTNNTFPRPPPSFTLDKCNVEVEKEIPRISLLFGGTHRKVGRGRAVGLCLGGGRPNMTFTIAHKGAENLCT